MQGKGRDIEHHMIQCGWNGGLLEGYGEEEAGEVGERGPLENLACQAFLCLSSYNYLPKLVFLELSSYNFRIGPSIDCPLGLHRTSLSS